ncbi:hypothetical protein WCD74_06315 [Actinomycetospora sp. OC33-EN08]|uniref:Uncharacterized protein n=1 Tax=Actinomycetospora aurantiaca TaxID=3129233 RepID=A0ABU8MKA3_9PSEU
MDTAPRLLVVAALTVEGLAIAGLVLAVLTGPEPSILIPAVFGVAAASVLTVLALTHLARRRLVEAFGQATTSLVVAGAHGPHRHHDGGSGHDDGWWQPAPHHDAYGGGYDGGWGGGWSGCDAGSWSDHGGSDSGGSCTSDSGSSSSDSGSSGSSGD